MNHLLEVVKLKVEKAGLAVGMPTQELDTKIKESVKLAAKEDAQKETDERISEQDLDAVLEEIATQVIKGDIDGLTDLSELTIRLYDRVNYAYEYVFKEHEEEAMEIFHSMYKAMNGDTRGFWLYSNYIAESQELYSDEHTTFVVVIDVD
ncbi:hypothetical protein bcgnr5378_06890 [Bacillus cereus]|uniref:Uncharacterized protein n=1 Tax=Bacillus cereus TaxID=1396 RepID=A0A164NWT1_BACCE|nr:hypothetical protein [Bacillus cereus]KZD65945.1 hypothetical protein B4088_2702 [Bacillus cereus]